MDEEKIRELERELAELWREMDSIDPLRGNKAKWEDSQWTAHYIELGDKK